ncbi:alpha/beta-hydrolase [Pleomassaria siparia CBS 279.74]|uniref:Alpha/beta-hydrolase n=1 Tax=Pleomassaria siparia CBS 279.74 TaxID=1314801 RepID=A0A6G1JXI8_9PLEO|nr:alpha/beta-hydrolase [Pleomassaria siparia CBS 279.74]
MYISDLKIPSYLPEHWLIANRLGRIKHSWLANNTSILGTKTHYPRTIDQAGPLLVCLHGLGGSTETFKPLVERLPAGYDIVLVDFQGFGKTPLTSTTKVPSIQGHVSDLHDLITSLQTNDNGRTSENKFMFVGHSLGAIVALQYAARYPLSVAGIALLGVGRSAAHIPAVRQRMLDVAATTRKEGIEYTAIKSVANNFPTPEQRFVPPENLEQVRRAVAASDREGYAKTCEMIVDPSHVDPSYTDIVCPSIFVAGDLDVISPVQRAEDVSKLMGGPSCVHVVESGHQPLIDDVVGTMSAIEKLLETVK